MAEAARRWIQRFDNYQKAPGQLDAPREIVDAMLFFFFGRIRAPAAPGPGFPLQFLTGRHHRVRPDDDGPLRDFRCNPLRGPVPDPRIFSGGPIPSSQEKTK
jgi:hypothetical protein